MVYAQAKLGKYTLMYNPFSFQRFFTRDAVELKTAGGYVVQDFGERAEVFAFKAWLAGAGAKDQLGQILEELGREDVVYFNSDPTGECWVKVSNFKLSEEPGSEEGDYLYQYYVELLKLGEKAKFKRCTSFDYESLPNDWGLEGSILVPLPVGAAGASEVADFDRTSDEGAIPCVDSPFASDITYEVDEANLDKARVKCARVGREVTFTNGLIKLVTRHDETTELGALEIHYYDGAAWSHAANLYVELKAKNNNWDNFLEVTPSVYAIVRRNRARVKLVYPSSPNQNYEVGLEVDLWYGKPFLKLAAFHAGPMALQMESVSYSLKLQGSSWRYYTRLGGVLDAQADAYGYKSEDGSNDSNNYIFVHDVNPIGSTAREVGFLRTRKSARYACNDAGTYWDRLKLIFEGLGVKRGEDFPAAWLFAQKQGAMGDRAPAYLGKEIVQELSFFASIKEVE